MFSSCITALLFCSSASALVDTYEGVGSPVVADDSVPLIFRLSYMYYGLVGTFLVFLIGVPISYFTDDPHSRCLDPKLFSPPIRKYLPKSGKPSAGEYILVNTDPGQKLSEELTKKNEVTGA